MRQSAPLQRQLKLHREVAILLFARNHVSFAIEFGDGERLSPALFHQPLELAAIRRRDYRRPGKAAQTGASAQRIENPAKRRLVDLGYGMEHPLQNFEERQLRGKRVDDRFGLLMRFALESLLQPIPVADGDFARQPAGHQQAEQRHGVGHRLAQEMCGSGSGKGGHSVGRLTPRAGITSE